MPSLDLPFETLYDTSSTGTDERQWYVFPWEGDEAEDDAKDTVIRMLEFIGEDAAREGLKETPENVVKRWEESFAGYKEDAQDFITSNAFPVPIEVGNLKYFINYGFSSTNQTDLMPFTGNMSIAYVPSLSGKVISQGTLSKYLQMIVKRAQDPQGIADIVAKDISEAIESNDVVVEITNMRDHFGRDFGKISNPRGVFTDNSSSYRKDFYELLREN